MIRPLTCVCILLAGGSGLYLYQSKHQAQMLDREIARTLKATDVARDRIGVLRGEWALLNEPERLAELAQAHLTLKTLALTQFATATELGARLPPPVLPGTVTIFAEEPDAPSTVAVLPAPAQPVPATPMPAPAVPSRANVVARQPSSTPNQLAVAVPPTPPHSITRIVEARATETRAVEHREDPAPPRPPMQVASALPMPLAPLPAPRPSSPHPVLAPVVNVSVSPITAAPSPAPRPAQARPVQLHAAGPGSATAAVPPRPAPQGPENPPIGESVTRMTHFQGASTPAAPPSAVQPSYNQASASALGGSRPALPPPVPFGSAMAASSQNAR